MKQKKIDRKTFLLILVYLYKLYTPRFVANVISINKRHIYEIYKCVYRTLTLQVSKDTLEDIANEYLLNQNIDVLSAALDTVAEHTRDSKPEIANICLMIRDIYQEIDFDYRVVNEILYRSLTTYPDQVLKALCILKSYITQCSKNLSLDMIRSIFLIAPCIPFNEFSYNNDLSFERDTLECSI